MPTDFVRFNTADAEGLEGVVHQHHQPVWYLLQATEITPFLSHLSARVKAIGSSPLCAGLLARLLGQRLPQRPEQIQLGHPARRAGKPLSQGRVQGGIKGTKGNRRWVHFYTWKLDDGYQGSPSVARK